MTALTQPVATHAPVLPALVANAAERASLRFGEYFTVTTGTGTRGRPTMALTVDDTSVGEVERIGFEVHYFVRGCKLEIAGRRVLMNQTRLLLATAGVVLALSVSPAADGPPPIANATDGQGPYFVVPHDGLFHIEEMPAFTFKATLDHSWIWPSAGSGTLSIYAPIPPELPSQRMMSASLTLVGDPTFRARQIMESGVDRRAMLVVYPNVGNIHLRSGIYPRLEYSGTLFARHLLSGKPRNPISQLTGDERRVYLATSSTMDFTNKGFLNWAKSQGLTRRHDEEVMQFAARVFTFIVSRGTYGGNPSSTPARRPSNVSQSLTTDCGGFSLLFTAIMRANGLPARTLFGRWSLPETADSAHYHVIAEFFVDGSGWVPVDIASTILYHPKDPGAFFGNADGQFIAFHLDTDLEPVAGFSHGWAQYLLAQWVGPGQFWQDAKTQSIWKVDRRLAPRPKDDSEDTTKEVNGQNQIPANAPPSTPGTALAQPSSEAKGALLPTKVNPKDGLTYVRIPPGKFQAGCSPGDTECDDNEKSIRSVTVSLGFWMGQTEVTQEAYRQVTRKDPSHFKGDRRPVEQVNWYEAQAYCQAVGLRLPTEEEWEYAARAGDTSARYGNPNEVAWYSENSGGETHEVGQKLPNAWSLYDMLGNVSEWTASNYDALTKLRCVSNFRNPPKYIRVSARFGNPPDQSYYFVGFRCAGQ
jgi:formylglycine-generating enzyme required for sulfatase activity